MGGCLSAEEYDNSGDLFAMLEWDEMAPVIYNACADRADIIIMTSDREEAVARMAFQDVGFRFHHLLIWNKITATANRYYMPDYEIGMYLFKGPARRILDCGSNTSITYPQKDVSHLYLDQSLPVKELKPHPTEKPVELMKYWLRNSIRSGEMVLDPCMGAGSTLVAAARLGVEAVGVEINPKWFDVACKRVSEALNVVPEGLREKEPVSEQFTMAGI